MQRKEANEVSFIMNIDRSLESRMYLPPPRLSLTVGKKTFVSKIRGLE